MRDNALQTSINLLLQGLDEAYDSKAWHGPNLKQSLRRVTAQEATWRPAPGRHNIWEIALHAAYWKYVVRRRLRETHDDLFPSREATGLCARLRQPRRRGEKILALLEEEHRKLRQAVRDLLHGQLRSVPWSVVFGAAFHDVYHAGQIQALKRLHAGARSG